MNKVILTIISIIVIIAAMITAIVIFKPDENDVAKNIVTKVADEEILDECTDEYEEIEKNSMVKANSEEEKISPNSSLTLKTYYKQCGHVISKYSNIPDDLVNLTKEQLVDKYKDYEIEKFTSNDIILYQEKDGSCGEHYIVKDENGKLSVYKRLENGEEQLIEETNISTDYLPETDKINMKNGIEANGKEKLNQLLEDFE